MQKQIKKEHAQQLLKNKMKLDIQGGVLWNQDNFLINYFCYLHTPYKKSIGLYHTNHE